MTEKTNFSQMTTLSYYKSQLKREFHREAFLMGREKKVFYHEKNTFSNYSSQKCLRNLFKESVGVMFTIVTTSTVKFRK